MNFLNGDDVLAGIKRGAERFGTSSAVKVVKAMARRINGIAPTEPEPYGLGMGGGETEQSAPTQAAGDMDLARKNGIPPARARQENKLAFLRRELELIGDPGERPAVEAEIASIEAELAASPELDPQEHQTKESTGGGKLENVDSSGLGYQSAQKTTTAERSKEPEMLSKCLACGYEAEHEWKGVCDNCMVSNKADVGGRKAMKENSPETTDGAFTTSKGKGPVKSVEATPDNDNGVGYVEGKDVATNAVDGARPWRHFTFTDDNGETVQVKANDEAEAWQEISKSYATPVADCKTWLKVRENAGHLQPDSWMAASADERVAWLREASQDISLAGLPWDELSLDVHRALQREFDKAAEGALSNASDSELSRVWSQMDADSLEDVLGHGNFTVRTGGPDEGKPYALAQQSAQVQKEFKESYEDAHGHLKNADPAGDLAQIERGAEGILHEAAELQEEGGLENAAESHAAYAKRVGKPHGSFSMDENGECSVCGWSSEDPAADVRANGFDSKASLKAERDAQAELVRELTAKLHAIEGGDGAHSHDSDPKVKGLLREIAEAEKQGKAAHEEYLKAHERENGLERGSSKYGAKR